LDTGKHSAQSPDLAREPEGALRQVLDAKQNGRMSTPVSSRRSDESGISYTGDRPKLVADTLLIAASFFGYAGEIKATLERRGRKVIWVEDRPATDTKTKLLLRIHPSLIATQTEAYFDGIIAQVREQPITEVLIIKGEAVSIETIERLRRACPKARFTLYFWDSYRNMPPGSADKVGHFDRAFSFDPVDVENDKRLSFRPLFYLDRFSQLPALKQDIDVLFLGTVHTDRYQVLKLLQASLPSDIRFEMVLYYPSWKLFQLRRVVDPRMWGAKRDEFIFEPVSGEQVTNLLARTRIAVDIERSVQSGFTIRTIEMIGASKKLITTNPRVQAADFYNPNNMAIIDRERPRLDEQFLRRPYEALPEPVLKKYALSGWVDEVVPPR
jgi:hypothetical protein